MQRPWDLVAVALFFIATAAMGVYFARRNESTEKYFLGGRTIPGWAIGLSMVGYSISSITFLAMPAAAYILDYRQVVQNLTLPVALVLAVIVFIPFFRRGTSASAFEYIERRYGVLVRSYASVSFIVLNLFRLGTVLYLVSLAVAPMLGLNVVTGIMITGVVVALYTMFGGIEAVIWTDVVQTIILLGGGVLCLCLMVFALPGGLPQVFEIGVEYNKFSLGPVSFALNDRTFLVVMLLGLVQFITEYSSNQNMVQRYIASKSLHEARKATVICGLVSIPTWLIFFFLGTCMFAYYRIFPDPALNGLEADQVLPHFILTKTPQFVGGVIISACLAAAMSSLSSSINAIATVSTEDFLKRFGRERSDRECLRFAKAVACVTGMLMIAGAVGIYYIPDKESMVNFGIIIGSMFGGGMFAIFMLGFFTTRVTNRGIVWGTAVALVCNVYLMLNTFGALPAGLALAVHSYWTAIIVNAVLAPAAFLFSALFKDRKDLTGLTVWTQVRR